MGCSPWGHKESDRTERLHFHFSLSWTGEGNGNPLQCSCLENPRGAWWAAVYGVAQSRSRLRRLTAAAAARSSRFIPVAASIRTSLSKAESYSRKWAGHTLLIHSSINEHSGGFHLWLIVNNALEY